MTQSPREVHVSPVDQDHRDVSDCWCQPVYEDVPPNGRIWVHRRGHDEPHYERPSHASVQPDPAS